MLFGKSFKVIKSFNSIFKKIGKYEEFYAFEKGGELEYCILDSLFGQPSPANWDESEYAKKLRNLSEEYLRKLLNEEYIEIINN